ncbi:uncharacterized protein [Physcomitrium patens]|uniref:Uncharacterized protein n=1 Tax=Physcomitrium patens TaxID=3218 RepID=A0A2K1K704_PHYPA|nr:uncharacterized protein LOC112285905 [Physcomitrium patens]PNR49547.1 hypothetical protein PHYPA_011443 [Physcomitrium patens]|eukprot:XP_024383046.1 uncharacterized protein LOC112285905 [Physcomitrella patens]
MGEMFEKARVAMKNFTDIFGKTDGDRSKCPRCKGSGFNSGNHFWNWNQSSPSTESCWFCEGVGMMPVIGLNGFMFGRSKPIINTKNVNPLPELPMKMQLYLGKYPETKCTVRTYKPSLKLADMLYDTSSFPSWMNGTNEGAVCSSSASTSAPSLEGGHNSSLLTSSANEPSKSSTQGVIRTGYRASNRSRVFMSSHNLDELNPSASRSSQKSPSKVLSSQESPASLSIERSTNRIARPTPRGSGGSLLVTVRKTVCSSTSISMRIPSSSMAQTSARLGALVASGNLRNSKVTRKSPLFRTIKSRRLPRRVRNLIREEAEKQAVQRAYKFQKPCVPPSEPRSSATSDSPVAETDSKQLSGTKLEHFGNFSLGSKEAVNSQNPWRKMIMSSGKISSDLTTFNQLTLGKVKDGIIRTPALGKAF